MCSFKFGWKEIPSKDFVKQRQATEKPKIDANKAGISDIVLFNNGKDWHYIVSYQKDEVMIIPLLLKTPKSLFNYDTS